MGSELYHYGVKGMKWGVRKKTKYVPKRWTNADRENEKRFGARGARRIRERMDVKGMDRKKAERREVARTYVTALLGAAAVAGATSAAAYALDHPGSVAAGRNYVNSKMTDWKDRRYDSAVLDRDGNVMYRFNRQ